MNISGTIGIIAHPGKPEAAIFAFHLKQYLEKGRRYNCEIASHVAAIREDYGLLVILGGDGFFMRASAEAVSRGLTMPLLGINLGNVGFLTLADSGKWADVVSRVLDGDFVIEERYALRISVGDETFLAVNDVYLRPRMGTMVVRVDLNGDTLFGELKADCLIVYSPMGSTGYNMSAGGPIIMSTVPCFGITTLAAMALNAKPSIIIDAGATVRVTLLDVKAEQRESMPLQMDGRLWLDGLQAGDVVNISCFKARANYVSFGSTSFINALHSKAGLLE